MSGFKKAVAEQAAIKMSMYGPQGSGKTFTALLFAEGIAGHTGKRVAFVDTERGTDFYAMRVAEREAHPEAFDFDALYTRSLTEILKELRALDAKAYSVVVLDSVSHLWDAAIAAYTGKKTAAGTIPMHAWGAIKKPYKDLMKWLIDSPYHVFLLGRQANVFEEDPDTGEAKAAGTKMRAEGETAYEPHICLHMTSQRTQRQGRKTVVLKEQVITAYSEKDRSGTLQGRLIEWPDFNNVIAPLLGLLGGQQAATPSEDDAAAQDAEANGRRQAERARESHRQREEFEARFKLCKHLDAVAALAKEITPAVKKAMLAADVDALRAAWDAAKNRLKGIEQQNGQPAPAAEGSES